MALRLNENGSSALRHPLFGSASSLRLVYSLSFHVSGSHRPLSTVLSCQGVWGEVTAEAPGATWGQFLPQGPAWAAATAKAGPFAGLDAGLTHGLPARCQALPCGGRCGCPWLPLACPAPWPGQRDGPCHQALSRWALGGALKVQKFSLEMVSVAVLHVRKHRVLFS